MFLIDSGNKTTLPIRNTAWPHILCSLIATVKSCHCGVAVAQHRRCRWYSSVEHIDVVE